MEALRSMKQAAEGERTIGRTKGVNEAKFVGADRQQG